MSHLTEFPLTWTWTAKEQFGVTCDWELQLRQRKGGKSGRERIMTERKKPYFRYIIIIIAIITTAVAAVANSDTIDHMKLDTSRLLT